MSSRPIFGCKGAGQVQLKRGDLRHDPVDFNLVHQGRSPGACRCCRPTKQVLPHARSRSATRVVVVVFPLVPVTAMTGVLQWRLKMSSSPVTGHPFGQRPFEYRAGSGGYRGLGMRVDALSNISWLWEPIQCRQCPRPPASAAAPASVMVGSISVAITRRPLAMEEPGPWLSLSVPAR